MKVRVMSAPEYTGWASVVKSPTPVSIDEGDDCDAGEDIPDARFCSCCVTADISCGTRKTPPGTNAARYVTVMSDTAVLVIDVHRMGKPPPALLFGGGFRSGAVISYA
jgi:hypothetical protein